MRVVKIVRLRSRPDGFFYVSLMPVLEEEKPKTVFKSTNEMYDLFKDIPEVIENNFRLALKCNFYPKELKPKLPKFITDINLKCTLENK